METMDLLQDQGKYGKATYLCNDITSLNISLIYITDGQPINIKQELHRIFSGDMNELQSCQQLLYIVEMLKDWALDTFKPWVDECLDTWIKYHKIHAPITKAEATARTPTKPQGKILRFHKIQEGTSSGEDLEEDSKGEKSKDENPMLSVPRAKTRRSPKYHEEEEWEEWEDEDGEGEEEGEEEGWDEEDEDEEGKEEDEGEWEDEDEDEDEDKVNEVVVVDSEKEGKENGARLSESQAQTRRSDKQGEGEHYEKEEEEIMYEDDDKEDADFKPDCKPPLVR